MLRPCHNPLCTNQVNDDDRFCGICGAYAGPEIPFTQQRMQCPNCGTPVQSQQKFCPNCGSWTTIHTQEHMPTQVSPPRGATTPNVSTSRVLPPLVAQHISSNEVTAVRDTMKNVYAPYMRNLLIGPRSFSWPPSDPSAQNLSKIELLTPDRDVTDFTLQAVLNNNFMTEGRLAYGPIGLHARGRIIFRLNSQAGEGYVLSLTSRHDWGLSTIRTHSSLSGELLPTPDIIEWKEGVLPSKHPSLRQALEAPLYPSIMIAIVAQGETIDFYTNLLHVVRVENANILEGKIGFHLFSLQKQHQNTYSSSYGYGTPNAAIESLKLWVP